MFPPKQILFPVDFSRRCRASAGQIRQMARQFDAELTLLHVVELPPVWFGEMEFGREPGVAAGWAEQWSKELDLFAEQEFADLAPKCVVRAGDAARLITEFATDQADLVMMPSHGYGPFRRFILGSVTAKVLHDTPCPVWTNVHVEDEDAQPKGFKNVICALDISEKSVQQLRFAADFSAATGANLWIVHALPVPDQRVNMHFDIDLHAYFEKSARTELDRIQNQAGVQADICMAEGDVADVVKQAALDRNADLVFTSRGHLGHKGGAVRTNAYAIIRESPCPVLSV